MNRFSSQIILKNLLFFIISHLHLLASTSTVSFFYLCFFKSTNYFSLVLFHILHLLHAIYALKCFTWFFFTATIFKTFQSKSSLWWICKN